MSTAPRPGPEERAWHRLVQRLASRRSRGARREPLLLALQGGGAFGAFSWGVLDRLLAEERFVLDGVSGTSAGAVNAVVLAHGLLEGGPAGARAALARFWEQVTARGAALPLEVPGFELGLRLLTAVAAPAQLNPLGLDPLRELLTATVDFERLRRERPVPLFLGATHVASGRPRVFREHEVSVETVLASACLPRYHHAAMVEGERFWDGGYSTNPPLLPLVADRRTRDLVLVRLSPGEHEGVPQTAGAIGDRVNHLVFAAPLRRELETITAVRRATRRTAWLTRGLAWRLRRLRVHEISVDGLDARLREHSALDVRRSFLAGLRDGGVAAATAWLDAGGVRAAPRLPVAA